MHTAWVKFGGVLDCFRLFFGMCEVAVAVGPLVEIDMDTINEEKIKAKCGVRDVGKIPPHVEITSQDLLMFRIGTELDSVVEMGWYKEDKRKSNNANGIEDKTEDEELRKKAETDKVGTNNVSLGSLSLIQIEEINKRNEALKCNIEESMGAMIKEMVAERGKCKRK